MGKLHSKLALKRRQNPEGGSLASSVLNCQKEQGQKHIYRTKLTKNLLVELRANKAGRHCDPNGAVGSSGGICIQINDATQRSNRAGVSEYVVPEEGGDQEWNFTLRHTDQVTEDDVYNLMTSLHKVLESTVVNSPSKVASSPLKIRLILTPAKPDGSTKRTTTTEKQSVDGRPVRRLYCQDENVERRNHYRNLMGIENFSSKFDNTETLKSRGDSPCTLQHHPVATRGAKISATIPSRSLTAPISQDNQVSPAGRDRSSGMKRFYRHQGKPSASSSSCHCCLSTAAVPHNRHCRLHKAPRRHKLVTGGDLEVVSPPSKRHEHHHYHEHHHHHHHHYHPE